MLGPIARTLAGPTFALVAPTLLLVSLTETVRATGAVPGDEFHAAGLLYAALGWLGPASRALGLLATALLLITAAGTTDGCRASRGLLVAAAAAIGAAPFVATPWCVIAATACLMLRGGGSLRHRLLKTRGSRRDRLEEISRGLSELAPLTILRWGLTLCALAAVGAFLVTLAESFVYTRHFAPELFPTEALLPYRWHLAELSAAFGLGLGLAYLLPILTTRILVGRRGGDRRPTGLLVLACIVSVTTVLYIGTAAFVHVGSEIVATGCLPHTIAFLLLIIAHVVSTLMRSFAALDYRVPGGDGSTPGRLWAFTAAASLLFPLSWLGARAHRLVEHPRCAFLLCAAGAGCWVTLLAWTSYPDLEDFRSKFIFIGVITAVHILVLGLLALVFTRSRSMAPVSKPRLAGLAIGLVALIASGARTVAGDSALILNEYSRFGYVVKKASLRELFHGHDLGAEKPAGHAFVKHGQGEDRLPKHVPAPVRGKRPPIICILWDAGRPDRMGCYGHDRDTTPHADRFAEDCVIFENAYSMSTATTCGVRHIMTGRYSTRFMLAQDHAPFFVHDLRRHGYDRFLVTAFGSDFNGVSIESFERGGPPASDDGAAFMHLTRHPRGLNREIPEPEKAKKMIEGWRRVHAERGSLDGTFSWLHFTGAHFPWYNRDAVKDFGDGYRDLYDGELAKVDALTGRAFDCLKELGAYDDAIIILFADHGTGLHEHGRWAGFLPYEEQVRIPLLVKMPGVAPRRVNAPVGTIDVAPTLLGLFEPGGENPYDGISLIPQLTDGTSPRRRHMVSLCAFEDAYALIEDGRWKLHYHRSEGYALLFDLHADPGEKRNLYASEPEVVARLEGVLGSWLWQGRGTWATPHHYRVVTE